MKFSAYLKEHIIYIVIGILFAVFPGIMLGLIENEPFISSDGFYCIIVMSFLYFCGILIDYIKQKLRCDRLSKEIGSKGLDFIVSLPRPITREQILYQELLLQLKNNAEEILESVELKKSEDIEFIEAWVHEIKTPIAATKLIIENNLDEPKEKVLYDISDEINLIEDMVQKTICYSQLNDFTRDCEIDHISIQKIMNRCIKREYSNIQNKHLILEISELDFEVISDEKWMEFILKQILDNAIKYSKDGGTIYISGINELHKQRIIIEDFGIGIRKEDIRRIFEKGYTGWNGRKKTASTGVGLFLSNKMANKLGHKINVISNEKCGTKVEIILCK